MAYAKAPKVTTDAVWGVAEFNRLAANAADTRGYLVTEHGVDGSGGHPWAQFGRHNERRIPRTVLRLQVTPGFFALDGGAYWELQLEGPGVGHVSRETTGVWHIVRGALASAWAQATPELDETGNMRWVRVDEETTPAGVVTGWKVTTLEAASSGADLEPVDYGFALVIHGDP